MNAWVYLGIVLFVIGLFTWLFAASKMRGLQNSFVPATPTKIRTLQIVCWAGIILFLGGIVLAIFTCR